MSDRVFRESSDSTTGDDALPAGHFKTPSGVLLPIVHRADTDALRAAIVARDRIVSLCLSIQLIDGDTAPILLCAGPEEVKRYLFSCVTSLALTDSQKRQILDAIAARSNDQPIEHSEQSPTIKSLRSMVIRARRLHQDALDEIAFDDEPKDSAASPLADEERQRQYAERLSSLHDSVAIGTVSIPPSAQGRKEAPADLIKKHYVEDYLPESSEYVRVFDRRKLEQIAAASAGISDCNSRIEPLLLNALAHGGFRLRAALSPQITERLHLLIEDFPNFDAVLEEIAEDVWLNLHRPVHARRFSPLLLAGPPGIGKTTVVDEISKRMGFSIEKIGVAGLTAGFVLVGADASWSSAKPGLIAASVARTAILDRIIVFDEIDKLRSDDRFPVLPVLLELLEPQTASRFKDHFLNIELDLTSAFVVATANDLSRIPQALLSRFKVVNVRPPDYEQRRRVIHSVLRRGFPEFTLEESLVDRLADSITDLRRLKRVLSKLFAVAARRSFAQTGSVQSSVTATQWDANRSGVFK